MPKPKKRSFGESVARTIIAPRLLKLLKPFSAVDLAKAIAENINLARGLEDNPSYRSKLVDLATLFPFAEKYASSLYSKRWVDWFIDNELMHSRPDLYAQIIYSPGGRDYIRRQIKRIVKAILP